MNNKYKIKRTAAIALSGLLLLCSFSSCSSSSTSSVDENGSSAENTSVSYTFSSDDYITGDGIDGEYETITLNGNSISYSGSKAYVSGSTITIGKGGTYLINGSLSDGQIIVNSTDKNDVVLALNGVNITCSTSSAIYVESAEKTIIMTTSGSENYLADGTSYTSATGPNATVYSKDDLTFTGSGTVNITGNYDNGINGRDDLVFTSGNINVTSVNNGIKGKDSVDIKNASITVSAGGDGIKSDNEEDTSKGYVYIESGTINVTAGEDGIQAETSVTVIGGTINITSGGGSANGTSSSSNNQFGGNSSSATSTDDTSRKGIKGSTNVTVTGGTITVNSADDSVHSNGVIEINGGIFTLSSGDDGIHADTSLTIGGGTIDITKSYEGIESKVITINSGTIHLVASDDGVNCSSGKSSSTTSANEFAANSENYLYINGGYLYVNAGGDGLDSNGYIQMKGGTAIVDGPTDNSNGALDYNGTFIMTGGTLIAAGSSGMAQTVSTSSTQYCVSIGYSSVQAAGTIVNVQDQSGSTIVSFAPSKQYSSVVICTPSLKNNTSYTVYSGGTSSGTKTDGLYSSGTYSGGTQYATFTVSSILTSAGTSSGTGGMGGNMGGGNMGKH